jgi:DNA-binding transcriptional LysR family regulator
MTVARWKALVAVADTGSVRAAAKRLYVTESAVSAAVTALSREAEVPLLDRAGRGVALTPAGHRYVAYLRQVLGLLEEARLVVRAGGDPTSGCLRLGAVTTVGDRLVPQLLQRFRKQNPLLDMRLEVAPSERVWRLFDDHAVDMVIAGRPPVGIGAVVRAYRHNELVVIGEASVARTFDPARTTWLMREPGSGTRATCQGLFEEQAISGPTMTLGSNGAVVAGAIAGLGVTLTSRDAVQEELATGRLVVVKLPGTPLVRPWLACTREVGTLTVDEFVRFLLDPANRVLQWNPVT